MIEELRQSQEVDLLTASKIYDEWNSNYRSKVKSEEEAEKERIQNLSTDELCLTILENLNYKNIHLDDRDIELYTEYYIKMQELHFNELKKRKIERKLTFFINKMAEWSRKYNLAAAEYQMTQANLRSKFMKDALVVSNKLKNQFQQIYETMTNSGAHLLLLDHPIKNLVLEMMVYLAKFENRLEEENRLYEDRTESGRPDVFAERELIFNLKDTIDRYGIKYSKDAEHKNQSIWIADLLNIMSNFKIKEWALCGWSEPFPFGNYQNRKIEKALEKKRKK